MLYHGSSGRWTWKDFGGIWLDNWHSSKPDMQRFGFIQHLSNIHIIHQAKNRTLRLIMIRIIDDHGLASCFFVDRRKIAWSQQRPVSPYGLCRQITYGWTWDVLWSGSSSGVHSCIFAAKGKGLVNVPFWGFWHHLQISVEDCIPNSWVMFNWDIYQPLKRQGFFFPQKHAMGKSRKIQRAEFCPSNFDETCGRIKIVKRWRPVSQNLWTDSPERSRLYVSQCWPAG